MKLRPLRIHDTLSRLILLLLLTLSSACTHLAEANYPQRNHTQAELDQMLAPIALYPDALLSQILMAASYPDEVAEAAQWLAANPAYSGSQAVRAVEADEALDWDPSIKSLVAFPQLLARMQENPAWTARLGDAFVAQQADVMDTIQSLRRRAMEQGSLRSNEQIYVFPQGQIITIEPTDPQVVHVPYYDPNIVYGAWWWAGYPPVYWAPWPGYPLPAQSHLPGRTGSGSTLIWSTGIAVGTGHFFGLFDWREHQVHVQPAYRERYYPRWHERRPLPQPAPRTIWRYEPERRHDRGFWQSAPQPQFIRPPAQRQPLPDADPRRDRREWHDPRAPRDSRDSRDYRDSRGTQRNDHPAPPPRPAPAQMPPPAQAKPPASNPRNVAPIPAPVAPRLPEARQGGFNVWKREIQRRTEAAEKPQPPQEPSPRNERPDHGDHGRRDRNAEPRP